MVLFSGSKNCMQIVCKFRKQYANLSIESRFAHRNAFATSCKLLKNNNCGSNSMVESQPSKLLVAGSIPVSRSMFSYS